MPTKSDPPTKKRQRASDEYDRFESLTKRLLRVPKEEIKRQENQEKSQRSR